MKRCLLLTLSICAFNFAAQGDVLCEDDFTCEALYALPQAIHLHHEGEQSPELRFFFSLWKHDDNQFSMGLPQLGGRIIEIDPSSLSSLKTHSTFLDLCGSVHGDLFIGEYLYVGTRYVPLRKRSEVHYVELELPLSWKKQGEASEDNHCEFIGAGEKVAFSLLAEPLYDDISLEGWVAGLGMEGTITDLEAEEVKMIKKATGFDAEKDLMKTFYFFIIDGYAKVTLCLTTEGEAHFYHQVMDHLIRQVDVY